MIPLRYHLSISLFIQSTLFSFILLVAVACNPPQSSQREIFDRAEEAYKEGRHQDATNDYSLFLASDPDPQLARLAERRKLSIQREIEQILGRQQEPRPVYLLKDKPHTAPALTQGQHQSAQKAAQNQQNNAKQADSN